MTPWLSFFQKGILIWRLNFESDMSNSIETPIDIDFLGGIDIGIDIDFGYPWKIDMALTELPIFDGECNFE